ncbi:hypothetical protein OPW41_13110 [Vibrio europaeus]|uniref:Uncharacterized protein n=1 Tax=Vibrio europaeus TaxID=300876 RepID=A0AAE7DW85_9VIBR|nr:MULTISPECIES: hypothetical protein [Vibrio]MCG9583697.1 hypothetical protein [Vibrio tubiashii]MCG9617275.1 hypothetical protein [Vibrio tubiashii]MCG9687116.1 hypothetical protein [Vibrio tubiashii]MDC5754718.1 hypothetical protein [Vibrio europaeus]MDC5776681.1 hypothetical protein [Vibrio europaeus]
MPLLFWALGGFGVGSMFGVSASKGLNKLLLLVGMLAVLLYFAKGGL